MEKNKKLKLQRAMDTINSVLRRIEMYDFNGESHTSIHEHFYQIDDLYFIKELIKEEILLS